MLHETTFVEFTHEPDTAHGTRQHLSVRDGARVGLRDVLDGTVYTISGGRQKGMRYTSTGYANEIVVKCRHTLKGWPADIPFKNLSEIGGGTRALLELQRRWHLPAGDQDRLRFEPATEEEVANARRDPESVHPNRAKLAEEKAAGKPAACPAIVVAQVFHPDELAFVGLHPTSTQPREAGLVSDEQAQRKDMGGRRRRRKASASGETRRVRRLPPKRGLTSARFVLPAKREAGDGGRDGGRPAKRARVEGRELAVDDPVDQFVLSSLFEGSC